MDKREMIADCRIHEEKMYPENDVKWLITRFCVGVFILGLFLGWLLWA